MTRQPDPIDVAVGARIRATRKRLGISQGELAGAVGRTFQQLQKYELGRNRVAASTLVRMAAYMGVPASALLGEEGGSGGAWTAPPPPDPEDLELARLIRQLRRRGVRRALRDLVAALARNEQTKPD